MTDLSKPIFTNETAARKHIEAIRWPDGPYCPYCGAMDKVKVLGGKSMGPGWYHCGDCRKKFTVRVGTLYERSKVPLHKWVLATHLMAASKKGISAHQLHRMLGVTYKTAWFMAHRIRESMREGPLFDRSMGGPGSVVEADETFLGKQPYEYDSEKGKWLRKRGYGDMKKVVSLVERGGSVRSFKVDKVGTKEIRDIVVTNVWRESILSTDEANHYRRVGREFSRHLRVNHGKKEYVRGEAHTNTIEGYFSIFKRGMKGVYQHCQEKHLDRYLAEYDFRYNRRSSLGIEDDERAADAIRGITGKRLTYRRTNSGQESQQKAYN
ncbi:MAG: IS1595 family transposase [Alphaproteobacteria bacterium]|nr:IS1595 family transposase [Alphaproteobacteria bacterium]